MAQALYDSAHTDGKAKRVRFSVKGRSYLPQAYMEKLGTRFANREAWSKIAETMGKDALFLSPSGGGWSWRNNQTWHEIARKTDASYDRTGGLWSGLHVRNYGADGAVVEFRGQSVGQTGGERKKRGRLREGEERGTEWTAKVNNRLKAWTVFDKHGALLVLPDRKTQAALEDAVEQVASNWAQIVTGGTVQPVQSATSGLAREFARAMGG